MVSSSLQQSPLFPHLKHYSLRRALDEGQCIGCLLSWFGSPACLLLGKVASEGCFKSFPSCLLRHTGSCILISSVRTVRSCPELGLAVLSPLPSLRELTEGSRLIGFPQSLQNLSDCCLFYTMPIYLDLSVAFPEASWEDARHSRVNSFGTSCPLGDIAKAKEKNLQTSGRTLKG